MFQKIKESISTIITITSLIGVVFAGYFYIENRYALAKEVQLIEKRLDQKILNDKLDTLEQRIWKFQDKWEEEKKMPVEIKEEYRKLKREKELTEQELKDLKKRD